MNSRHSGAKVVTLRFEPGMQYVGRDEDEALRSNLTLDIPAGAVVVGSCRSRGISKLKDRRIATQSWKVRGSSNKDELRQLIDGDPATRWTTRQTQRPGQAVNVDLGRSETFDLIRLNPGSWQTDAASGLKLEVSADGQTYREVTLEPIADIAGAYNCSEPRTPNRPAFACHPNRPVRSRVVVDR